VGSITAAMAARIFSEDGDNSEYQRRSEIVRLAATFLALDHLIVTDRFADFVRRLTLRAAETNFSLRDLDRILRRYDIDPPEQFSDTARAVVAGIEHLLYISPWELEQLIRTMRLREYRKTILLLRSYCQELLDRGNVGLEVLGTEPLSLLIQQHVITEWMALHPSRITADVFRKRGLHVLATMTNLTSGELEVVGMPPKKGQAPRSAAKLVETLLASSAFPGVFRPRWGWEIFEGSMARAQFIDGGVMDNLPLNPIVDFLVRSEGIPRRTTMGVPHLLFTASLESDIRPIGGDDLRDIAARWPEAQKRAKQMQYNKKVDGFANVQADMRAIYDAYIAQESDITQLIPIDPLSLAVVVVKPKWLCDTFAFHPMLGFKRSKQAASIAHGCASTFQRFVKLQDEDKAARIWLGDQGWDLRVDLLRDLTESGALKGDTIEPKARADGRCHFTSKIVCPFAAATGIESVDAQRTAMLLGFGDKTAERPLTTAALREIYDACGKRATHQPQA
ncbi:MAG: Patatin, partial [Acidobacteria bacterium]|nr:Patatin [Acidobacteriota bacterium]